MRKIALIFILLLLPGFLAGCYKVNKSTDYSNFVRRDEGKVAGQEVIEETETLRIFGVYPSEISTEGKEQITVYGAGFERGTSVFLQNPEMKIEAFVFNPGYLQAWMPPFSPGHYILGVINPDGKKAWWSGLLTYVEEN
ncbi:MAG: IPT/TIG domain-containing protein [Patescibacteria group bacterium]